MKGALPLSDELGQGRRAVQGKCDSLAGLAQPQHSIQACMQQVVEVVLVFGCTQDKIGVLQAIR